jgi:small-conductance mechanosensitive channel
MKKMVLMFVVLAISAPLVAFAQSEADVMEMTREVVRAERKALVAENMQLNEAESQRFWPVYNEYQNEVRKIGDRRLKLLQSYAYAYENLTEMQAEAFLKESMEIQKAKLELQQSFIPKFKEVLSPKMVARFYQIDHKLDAIIEYDLAAEIPLVMGK